jgi:hypothetical protein
MINNLILPKSLLVKADPKRVVLHWTAGGKTANDTDKMHYHLIVENSGKLVPGYHTIADNDATNDGRYAAHTRMLNTRSIGVALAGMAGSRERPFDPGSAPISHSQYEIGCRAIAELCHHYDIPVTEKTVLNHGEVEKHLGVEQRSKWDVMVFPWAPALNWEQVGEKFRSRVSYYLAEIERVSAETAEPVEKKADLSCAVVTAKSGLRMRAGPGIGFPTVTVVPFGTILSVVNYSDNGWAEVEHSGLYGFMALRYLDLLKEEPKG